MCHSIVPDHDNKRTVGDFVSKTHKPTDRLPDLDPCQRDLSAQPAPDHSHLLGSAKHGRLYEARVLFSLAQAPLSFRSAHRHGLRASIL